MSLNDLKQMYVEGLSKSTGEETDNADTVETKDAEPDTSSDVDAEENNSESVDADSESQKESDSGEHSETASVRKKKNTYQGRIDAKHAEAMRYKEQVIALQARLEALESERNKPEKKNEASDDEVEIDSVEDLQKVLRKMVTADQLNDIVAKAIEQQLSKAKETIQRESQESKMEKLKNEFESQLYTFYQKYEDDEGNFPDDIISQASQINALVMTNPEYYVDVIKKRGMGYIKKFVTGELEAEKKAESVKKIIQKADAVKTNNRSAENVVSFTKEESESFKNPRDFFQSVVKKLKQ